MTPTTAYLLYFIFALGGVALYLMLPGGAVSRARPGALLGILAVGALLVVLGLRVIGGAGGAAYFYLFSTLAILAAARVITHRKPVYSAIYFVLVVVSTAALLVLLRAEFLAVALVIIYAGAIIVTYLFVIMLAQQSTETVYDVHAREPFLAVLAGFVLMGAIAGQSGQMNAVVVSARGEPPTEIRGVEELSPRVPPSPVPTPRLGNTYALARVLMTEYVVVLQIAGVLLLVSMIGAVALSRKRVPSDGPAVQGPPLGQVGKEVTPF